MAKLVSQIEELYAEIVINCEPTYTPDRGRYRVIHRNLRRKCNYSEI